MTKQPGRVLLLTAVIAAAAACVEAAPPARPTAECAGSIAFMGALSGGNASFVLPSLNGAKLALKSFQERHPVCKIELVPFDTEGDPAKATPVANKIAVDERFLGVIGGGFSGETRQTKAIYDAAGVTMISPSATATDLSVQDPAKVFHRVVGHDKVQGAAIARYLIEVLDAAKVFIVDDGTAYGGPLARKVSTTIDGNVAVTRDRIQEKQTDFSATISKITVAEPDVVFYAGYANEAGPFLKQLRGAGVTVPFIGGDGLFGSDFPKAAGRDAEGAIVTCPCLPPTEVAGSFARDYEIEFGEAPGSYAGEGYDAATIFFEALAVGNDTRERVEAFVDAYDRPGVTKHIKFDSRGDIDLGVVVIWAYRIKDGRLIPDQEISFV